jgi:predicted RNA-binding protein YlqC (UPF0109 family)
MSFFPFFFYKIREQEGRQVLLGAGVGVGTSGRGKVAGKGGRRVSTVQKNVYACM